MDLHHEIKEETLLIRLEGEVLDASQSAEFKQQVLDLIDQAEKSKVVFDLQHLKFIDSSGLGAFLFILRYTKGRGGDLRLAQMTEPVFKMFQIVRMHTLFENFDRAEDAIASFTISRERQG